MGIRLTDKVVRELDVPTHGNRIVYDTEISGFGIRITARGRRSFVLNYTVSGRERRITIGQYGIDAWNVAAARRRAGELRRYVDSGNDPLADREERRSAPTIADLAKRYIEEQVPKTRPSTAKSYRQLIDGEILPALRHLKVAMVTFADVDDLHRNITSRGRPYRANRTIAVLSRMFSLAIKWRWRNDNPVRGLERNQEPKRDRYLSSAEVSDLLDALDGHRDRQASDIIRLLLLTGARRGEVQSARWADIDLDKGVWSKPGATTKQKSLHRVPLSGQALEMLRRLRSDLGVDAVFVFPKGASYRREIKDSWAEIREAAKLGSARMHDLRHTFASFLASAGTSLPIIGALLGHTQPATTARYAHFFDDPLRTATEKVSASLGRPEPKETE